MKEPENMTIGELVQAIIHFRVITQDAIEKSAAYELELIDRVGVEAAAVVEVTRKDD